MTALLPRRIGLLVGNGLSLSVLSAISRGAQSWSTQNPLRWNITNASAPNRFLVDEHPELGTAYRELRDEDPEASDFVLIDRMLRSSSDLHSHDFGSTLAWQLRNYLAMAFSHFQLGVLDPTIRDSYSDLGWSRWLSVYGSQTLAAISFNYDLVLERLLSAAGISASRPAVEARPLSLPITKPHSSIDFGPAINVGAIFNSDVPQRLLARDEMLLGRREWTIVLPGEPSQNGELQWVRPGVEDFRQLSSTLTHVVILGLSYWEADRVELDYLLDRVSSDTKVVMANPNPSPEWMERLRARHRRIEVWPDDPRDLD